MQYKLNTPLPYYGGKQKMLSKILSRIPQHTLYAEPFTGGAAVYFGKPPSATEVINDTNKEVMNFYRVIKDDFVALEKEIRITLHSRDLHRKARTIYANPDMFSELKRAWAVWVLATQSFSTMLDGSWGFDKTKNRTPKTISNRKSNFTEELAIRLQNTQIECADALYIIKSRDMPDAFFYCDPPYYNSDCGHYDGYTIEDYEALLKCLAEIKGKFLLSSYPSDILLQYAKKHGWKVETEEMKVSVNAKSGYLKKKIECLTSNY